MAESTTVAFVNENAGKHHLEERKLEIFPFYEWYQSLLNSSRWRLRFYNMWLK